MKNFVLISPNFPKTYYQFAQELKRVGFRVLAISYESYDNLSYELKDSLTEYYKVDSLENYDEVYRAMAYFSYKYGHIDFVESNNEYWLQLDARLRTDFNITTGRNSKNLIAFQSKELEKKYYMKAGVKTARYVIPTYYKKAKEFIDEVGYPVVVKPVVGVGAAKTYKINNLKELKDYFNNKPNVRYIMEEFVPGEIISFDGVADKDANVVFSSNEVFPVSVMDVVNEKKDFLYYSNKEMPKDLEEIGKRVVKAFNARYRYFHLEFFRLYEDKKGLGKKGEIIALETNMRCPGGYTPDVINFSKSVSSYRIFAETMADLKTTENLDAKKYYTAYVGRRYGKQYEMSNEDIYKEYGSKIVMHDIMPSILASDMGDESYAIKVDSLDEVNDFFKKLTKTR